jgi:peptidoglycan-associated lipoprotein
MGLLFSVEVNAQQKRNYTQEADQAFEDKMFNLAIDKYKKALTKIKRNKVEKNRIAFQIAECYRLTNNMKKAEAEFKRLEKLQYYKVNALSLLYYADALKINEKYEAAIIQYNHYKEEAPNDPRGEIGVESSTVSQKWKDNPTRYAVNPSDDAHKELNAWKPVNGGSDDFSPSFGDDKGHTLVFTSSRENSTGNRIDDWTGQNFTDLYYSTMSSKGDWSQPLPMDDQGVLNSEGNEGNSSFNAKFTTMYFTRCGFEKKKQLGCMVYKTEKKGKAWSEPEAVKLGTDTTKIYGHPSISKDELTIYFASDIDGGQGGKDIWMATRAKKSKEFDTPKNLGPEVNTPGDEMFPFLRTDSILYFSSNYHAGMGGMDIFRTEKAKGNKWAKPENMRSPINSSADDFAITFFPNSTEEKGYFASNRKDKTYKIKGGDDIYSFIKIPLVFTLEGVVKDDRTLQYIDGALVKMVGSDGTSIEVKTDRKGYYDFDKTRILPNTSYDLTVTKDGYFSDKGRETTVGLEQSKDLVLDFVLVPIPVKPIVLPEILYDLARWELLPQYQDSLQGLISTLEANPTMTIELGSHTDTRDTDIKNDTLSLKRAQSVVNYLISRGIDPDRLTARGYGERIPRELQKTISRDGYVFLAGVILNDEFINGLKSKTEQEVAHQLNRRTEMRIVSMNFVPKAKIDTTAKAATIQIVTNPNENAIPITMGEGDAFEGALIMNEYAKNFKYTKALATISFSLEEALGLLTKGFISKSDFLGDVNKSLANGTIADKSKFNIKKLVIGKNTLENVEAVVLKDQKSPIELGDSILNKIGKFKVDKDKKVLIFE